MIKVDILNQVKQELITNDDFNAEEDDDPLHGQNSKNKDFKCQVL